MFEITKDRNLLSIRLYEAQTTPYILDINTGIFLGQQGKPIKTTPKYWRENLRRAKCDADHPLRNLVYALYLAVDYGENIATKFRDDEHWRRVLGMCDRFQSIGYLMEYADVVLFKRDGIIPDKAFKAFAKYFKDHPTVSYSEWKDILAFENWCNEHHVTIDDHFTKDMADLIRDCNVPDDRIKWYAHYLSRGLYDFAGLVNFSRQTICSWIKKYLDCVEKMGQQPQKGDFLRLYTDTVRAYNLRKAEFDNRAIAEHQNSKLHALQFEDDNFIVRVPMTSNEIIAEGEAQNNCVGRLYLPRVIDHNLHIVFVRRKSDPDKSFITCEVRNDGFIGQYLLRFNNYVDRYTPEHEFRQKYQNFLNENWNRA
jgi:hypothetical protein